MADTKISDLPVITGSEIVGTADIVQVIDTSSATNKKITVDELFTNRDASNITIHSGTITGITDLAVADGGTGASTASDARTNLGVAIGSDVQAHSANLDTYVSNPLTSDELTQLQNINTNTITVTQWGFLGALDQGLSTTDDVVFAGFTSTGIDDNATDTALLLTDTATVLGQVSASFTLRRSVDDESLFVSGGNASNSGANLVLYGASHANGGDFLLRDGTTTVFMWDKSDDRLEFLKDINLTGSLELSGTGTIGDGASANGNGDDLVVSKDQTDVGLSILAEDGTGFSRIYLGSQTAPTASKIQYSESTGALSMKSEGPLVLQSGGTVDRLTIDASGNTSVSAGFTFGGEITELTGTMPSGTTPAIDPVNGTVQEWTLTGNSTPTDSLADGESVLLQIDDGSSFTITWPTMEWLGGSAPTLDTSETNVIAMWKTGSTLYGNFVGVSS